MMRFSKRSKRGGDYLESLIGKKIEHFAYPYGSYNKDCIKVLNKLNYKSAVTVKTGGINMSNNLFELRRMSIDKGKMNFIVESLTKVGVMKWFNR